MSCLRRRTTLGKKCGYHGLSNRQNPSLGFTNGIQRNATNTFGISSAAGAVDKVLLRYWKSKTRPNVRFTKLTWRSHGSTGGRGVPKPDTLLNMLPYHKHSRTHKLQMNMRMGLSDTQQLGMFFVYRIT